MNQFAQPNPAQVPTLTEVIELLSPTPVADVGMNNAPRPAAPAVGSPGAAPIVTSGLQSSQPPSNWTPMSTVVLPSLPVVDLPVLQSVVPEPVAMAIRPVPVPVPAPVVQPVPEINEAQLTARVLGDVQRQLDGMLDFRLREAISPILARHSEALVRDLREELSSTMRDVVARSVAQEVAKLRQR